MFISVIFSEILCAVAWAAILCLVWCMVALGVTLASYQSPVAAVSGAARLANTSALTVEWNIQEGCAEFSPLGC